MSKAGKTSTIKYEDKSEGQPGLVIIFNELRKLLSGYVKGNYVAKNDLPGNYSVYYNKEVEILGRKYPDIPMAGILVQKGYVGLYFFCIYTDPELKKQFPSELLKHLKGKTCFHIKKSDPALLKQVGDALQTGYQYFLSKGWK